MSGYERIEALLSLNRAAEAEALARQHLVRGPDDLRLLSQLARSLLVQSRAKEALVAAQEFAGLSPGSDTAHRLVAQGFLLCKKPMEAVASAEEAVRLDPQDGWNHYVLALALFEWSSHADARAAIRRAVRLDPEKMAFLVLYGYLHLIDRHDQEKARKAFKRALRIEPDNTAAALGLTQARAGEVGLGKTIRALQRSLSVDPAEPDFAYEVLLEQLRKMLARQQWIAWGAMFCLARWSPGGGTSHPLGRFAGGVLFVAGIGMTWNFFANMPEGGWRLIRSALSKRLVLVFLAAATAAYFVAGLVWVLTGSFWAMVFALGSYLSRIAVALSWWTVQRLCCFARGLARHWREFRD